MHHLSGNPRRLGFVAGLLFLAGAPSAWAQIVVDQANGVAAPCGGAADPCALLSHGIAAAAPGDIITVGNGTYTETDLLIDFDVTIESAPGTTPILDAGGLDRHFRITGTPVNPLGHVALRGLTLQNGNQTNGIGGAIRARWIDDLTVEDVTFTGNVVSYDGGAIAATGTNLTIIESEFRDNFAGELGGAIYYVGDGTGTSLTITSSILAGNTANMEGGAVFKGRGDLELTADTLSDNQAGNAATQLTGRGGAIKSEEGTLLVDRSTFSGNQAVSSGSTGGAIDASGGQSNDVEIINSTFHANEAGEGAALQVGGTTTTLVRFSTFKDNTVTAGFGSPATITNIGSLEIRGTIIADSSGNDCDGTGAFTGLLNRIRDACFGVGGELTAVTGLDNKLSLQGGFTESFGLHLPSNAVNQAPPGVPLSPLACPPIDQRGHLRPLPGGAARCDIGSVETF